MKKVKMILSLIVGILSVFYLSSCIRKSIEPKVYMYNPEVDFSTMEFDLKVVEPEEILIKEIYIKLYKENEVEQILSSMDGINKVGVTEDIKFKFLAPQTRYKLEFCFDYFEEDYENEDVVIYSYNFTTSEDTGISASLSNFSQYNDGSISFDATYKDDFDLMPSINIYLLLDDVRIKHYGMKDGLEVGINKCQFLNLLPNENYIIAIYATFTYKDTLYEDYLLDSMEIKISSYFTSPRANFYNVSVEEDVVNYRIDLYNYTNSLKYWTVVLMDSNNVILQQNKINPIKYSPTDEYYFNGLYPNTFYTLKVMATYKSPSELVQDEIIAEYNFKTKMFSILPKATIFDVETTTNTIKFCYDIHDPHSLLQNLRCVVLDMDDVIVEQGKLSKASCEQFVIFNKPSQLVFFKIQIIADYSYVYYEKKNEIIGSYEFLENVGEDFEFNRFRGEIEKYIGESKVCIIPEKINGFAVKSIAHGAFSESNVTRVIIPDSVTTIEYSAFQNCNTLESVSLGNGVTSIGNSAFSNCTSLTSITIPNSVTIGTSAFYECSNLTSVKLGYGITNIGSYTFARCSSLQSVVIPNTVTAIAYSAFLECSSLESVSLGYGVQSIGEDAFSRCTSLTSITIPNSVISIGVSAFYECSNLASVKLGKAVTSIGGSAFAYCSSLQNVVIPDSVTGIGASAFYNCTKLESVSLGNGVQSIGRYAFEYCSSLQSLVIPDSVTSIGEQAFFNCTSLTTISIGNGITTLTSNIFNGGDNLTSITIGNGVTNIGYDAFRYFNKLINVYYEGAIEDWCNITFAYYSSNPMYYASHFYLRNSNEEWKEVTSITIPNTVTKIGDYQFYNFDNLISITIPDNVTSIGINAFYHCDNLTNVTLGNGVTTIYESAFRACASLRDITLGNSIKNIGASAFYECLSLKNVIIPDGVTSIGESCFAQCSSLTSVFIPQSVKRIEKSAFSYCSNLEDIYYYGTASEWNNVSFSYYDCCFYSFTQPLEEGNYWHYDGAGNIVKW